MSGSEWFVLIFALLTVVMMIVNAYLYPLARFTLALLISGVCFLNSLVDWQKQPGSWFWGASTLVSGFTFLFFTVWLFRWYAKKYKESRG